MQTNKRRERFTCVWEEENLIFKIPKLEWWKDAFYYDRFGATAATAEEFPS